MKKSHNEGIERKGVVSTLFTVLRELRSGNKSPHSLFAKGHRDQPLTPDRRQNDGV
jgi:hypothetical protein